MSKHWKPFVERDRYRSPSGSAKPSLRISAAELRLVLLAGLLLGFGYAGLPVTAYAGETVEVIDGDTFRYRGEKIRVADIDTPELRGRCPAEAALAARATDRMSQLLRQGPFELRSIDRDEDRYGRKLRVVVRNGRSLGDQLVAEGLARTWTGRREPWCA